MSTIYKVGKLLRGATMLDALDECRSLVDHALSLGIGVESVILTADEFSVTLEKDLPEEQREHLRVTVMSA